MAKLPRLLALLSLAIVPLAFAQGANIARYAAKNIPRLGIYGSGPANVVQPVLAGQAELQKYSGLGVGGGASLAVYYAPSNVNFMCPGYSILVGFKKTYDSTLQDNVFEFFCAFSENPQGQLLIKTCSATPKTSDNPQTQSVAVSSCSASQFVGGYKAIKWDPNLPAGQHWLVVDRETFSTCCSLADQSGKAYTPQSGCTTQSFKAGTSFTAMCPTGMFVQKIGSAFYTDSNDRAMDITCCNAGN